MVPVAPLVVTGLGATIAGVGYWLHTNGTLARWLGKGSPMSAIGPASGPSPALPKAQVQAQAKAAAKPDPMSPVYKGSQAEAANTQNLGKLDPKYENYTEQVKEEGKAVPAAKALYAHLKSRGVVTDTPVQRQLVLAFQKAHNSDRLGKGLGGALSEDGMYGPGTSGALTMYTNDPIPGDPRFQPRAATLGEVLTNKVIGENGSNAGVAYRSQFNLVQYLKKHGLTHSADQKALVRQFQVDVNTDPLFPGPAYKPSPKPPIVHPALVVDGLMGPKSKGILLFGSSDEDFPIIAKALKGYSLSSAQVDMLRRAGKPVHLL